MARAKSETKPVAVPEEIQVIPLTKLLISPKNVRKTPTIEAEDAEILASIRTVICVAKRI